MPNTSDDAKTDHQPVTSPDSNGSTNPVTRDLEIPDEQLDGVRGGKTPTPSGPVPVPYPN